MPVERRKVYAAQGSLPNIPQYFIKYNNKKLPLQGQYYSNGLPLLTDNNGLSFYTLYNGIRIELEDHPYEKRKNMRY